MGMGKAINWICVVAVLIGFAQISVFMSILNGDSPHWKDALILDFQKLEFTKESGLHYNFTSPGIKTRMIFINYLHLAFDL